jgi:hypothetical protein
MRIRRALEYNQETREAHFPVAEKLRFSRAEVATAAQEQSSWHAGNNVPVHLGDEKPAGT